MEGKEAERAEETSQRKGDDGAVETRRPRPSRRRELEKQVQLEKRQEHTPVFPSILKV